MTAQPSTENKPLGVILILTAMFTMTAMDAAVKWAVADYSIQQINFIRSVAAMIVLAPVIRSDGGLNALRTQRPWVHVWRAFLLIIIGFAWFFALGRMKLADVGAIVMISPLLITALSGLLLKEHVGMRRWIAVVAGFTGMLIIVRPGTGVFNPVALLVVMVALGYALYVLSSRANRDKETLAALTYYPLFGIFIISGALSPLDWTAPTVGAWSAMIFVGVCAGIGHVTLTLAFRYASPPVLAPLEYTGLIWAVILGYALFDELPDQWTVVGMCLIASAGIFVVYREALASPESAIDAAKADFPA